MYKEIKSYIDGLIETYELDTYEKAIQEFEVEVTNDISEYYNQPLSLPAILIPYKFTIAFMYSMENNKNIEDDFRDAIENLIYSEELGYNTASGAVVTINSEKVFIKLESVFHNWTDNMYQSAITITFTHMKFYNRTT